MAFMIIGIVFFLLGIMLYVLNEKRHSLLTELVAQAKLNRTINMDLRKETQLEWRKIAVAMAALEATYGPRFEVLIPETARNQEVRNAFIEELELIREEIRAVQSGRLPGQEDDDEDES